MKQQLQEIAAFDISKLSEARFSNAIFRDVRIIILKFQELSKQLSEVEEILFQEHPLFSSLEKFFRALNELLKKIMNHSQNENSEHGNGKYLRDELVRSYQEFIQKFSNVTFLVPTGNAVEYLRGLEKNYIEGMNVLGSMIQLENQIKELYLKINNEKSKEDTSKFSTKFQENAKSYKRGSWGWLFFSFVFFGLTVLGLIYSKEVFTIEDQKSTFEIAKYISSKVLSLTLLISAALWCAKIFKVNKNLSVIYEHKSNSLATFTEFVNSAQTEATKEFVLKATTQTIFSLPETGLFRSDDLPVQSFSKVIDLVKSSTGKSQTG